MLKETTKIERRIKYLKTTITAFHKEIIQMKEIIVEEETKKGEKVRKKKMINNLIDQENKMKNPQTNQEEKGSREKSNTIKDRKKVK